VPTPDDSGSGVATWGSGVRGPGSGGFAGRYDAQYFLETGEFSEEYDLHIEGQAGGEFYGGSFTASKSAMCRWKASFRFSTQSGQSATL
jgi:hypothetical protein